MKLPKVIYVMGPPGAGKGTQAEMLAQKIGYHRFSTGDAFRAQARQNTPLGRRVKETIDNGYLMPPEDAAAVVTEAVREHLEQGRGLIFDASPRTVTEAAMIDAFFEEQGYGRPLVISLKIDKKDMIERNSKRKFCLDIEGDFPVVSEEDVRRCEELGGRIGIRPDDEPEKFETRWSQFTELTYPIFEKYQEEGILREVDGKKSIEDVHEQVIAVIEEYERD